MFPENNKNKVNKIKDGGVNWVQQSIGTIATVMVSLAWLFSGFFQPGFQNVPIWLRIVNSALTIFVSLIIASSLGIQAILTAMEQQDMINIMEAHRNKIIEANDYVEYSDEWEDIENLTAYKKARTHILSQAGLKYSEYFDNEGVFTGKNVILKDDPSKLDIKQYKLRTKALNKALNLRLTHVTFAAISTTDTVDYDVNALGSTPMEFNRLRSLKKLLSKLLTVGILSQITWNIAVGQNVWQSLFNGALQLAVFLILGAIEYLVNWNYVKYTYKSNVERKINLANNLIDFGKSKQRGEINATEQE